MDSDIVAWIREHLLKLVELFVVVPVGIAAAILALVVAAPWWLIAETGAAPPPPDALRAIVRWPYDAVRHIFTGRRGFQWTPRL